MIGYIQAVSIGNLMERFSGNPCSLDHTSLGSPTIVPSRIWLPPKYTQVPSPPSIPQPHFGFQVIHLHSCCPQKCAVSFPRTPWEHLGPYFQAGRHLTKHRKGPWLMSAPFPLGREGPKAWVPDGRMGKCRRINSEIFMLWTRPRPNSERQRLPAPCVSSLHGEGMGHREAVGGELEALTEAAKNWETQSSFSWHLCSWWGQTGYLGCEPQKHNSNNLNMFPDP